MTKKPGYPRWLLNKEDPSDKVGELVPCPRWCLVCGERNDGLDYREWSEYCMHVGHDHGIYNMWYTFSAGETLTPFA
jgi:hypothetical protein